MTDELVEEIARVLDDWIGDSATAGEMARAISPIIERLQIEAAKRMQEAASNCAKHLNGWGNPRSPELADHIAKCISQIDPATIIGAKP